MLGRVFCQPAWEKLRHCTGGVVSLLLEDSQDDIRQMMTPC